MCGWEGGECDHIITGAKCVPETIVCDSWPNKRPPHWIVRAAYMWCYVMWCYVVWYGVMWCGMVWCGMVWCDVVWCDVIWCDVMWCYVVLYGVMWCDMMSCDVVWCDVIWCGMVWFFGASWRRTGRAGGEVKWLGGKIRWCRCWDKLTSANWAAVRAGSYSHTIKWQVNQRSNSSRREEAETTLLGSVIEVMAHEEKRRRSTVEGTRKEGGRECVTRGNRERNVSNEGGVCVWSGVYEVEGGKC